MKIILIELLEFVYPELFHSTLSKSIIILYISAKHEIGANFKTAVVTNHDDILECKICLVNVWNNYEAIHSFFIAKILLAGSCIVRHRWDTIVGHF